MPDERPERAARRLTLTGRVQGVGFRPFVWRLAQHENVSGWVCNDSGRVEIHAEGSVAALARFARRLTAEAPALARPHLAHAADVDPAGMAGFAIRDSAPGDAGDAHLPPDLFTCDACLAEMADRASRRYRYPFTNCTQCGPRYTIVRGLPYDRAQTSMAGFAMCALCAAEYADPADRRFHAQPLCCPACGPRLCFESAGGVLAKGNSERVLAVTVALLRVGGIAAVRGIGGYHLLCDARSDAAVMRLRARKHRPTKPLAVMFPQTGPDGLDSLRADLAPDAVAEAALRDPARPIVLVAKRPAARLADEIAPGLAEVGAFLPYSPLHHLILADFGGPLVATSANLSGEPVLTDAAAVRDRLAGVADGMVHHDRPILRPADDTVRRVIAGAARPVRLGRGSAPVEIVLPGALARPTVATGGQGKVAPAIGWGDRAILAPHVGDLDSPRARDTFASMVADIAALHDVSVTRIAHDAHPGYATTDWAARQGVPRQPVWHHHAHASALALERPGVRDWAVLTWDAVGLGPDGTIRGGEALIGRPGTWRDLAGLRPFHPQGADAVAHAPWRSAAALVWAIGRDLPRPVRGADLVRAAWARGLNAPRTASVGRLLDGCACLILGIDTVSHDAEAPMTLEAAARGGRVHPVTIPLIPDDDGLPRGDWRGLVAWLLDTDAGKADRAATVHAALADLGSRMLALAPAAVPGLTGGVAQNRCLAEALVARLGDARRDLVLPDLAPANDGGLSLGQMVETLAMDGVVAAWRKEGTR